MRGGLLRRWCFPFLGGTTDAMQQQSTRRMDEIGSIRDEEEFASGKSEATRNAVRRWQRKSYDTWHPRMEGLNKGVSRCQTWNAYNCVLSNPLIRPP